MTSALDSSSLPYLIIGGGLAGFALAQSLKAASIPFHVYEKDDNATFRAQGYRIRIRGDGASGLQSLLPPDLFTVFERTCGACGVGGHQMNALTGEEMPWPSFMPQRGLRGGPGGAGGPDNSVAYNADRAMIRQVLLTDLEEHITFGKKFLKYELHEHGVTAIFTDGTTAQGRMIIGADGVRSQVRKQMLPDFTVLDTEGRAIFGKTPVTQDIVPPQIGQRICVTSIPDSAPGTPRLFSDIMRFDRGYDSPIPLPVDYIYWVLVFHRSATSMSDQELLSLSRGPAAQKAAELVKEWHPSFRAIIDQQDPQEAAALAFFTTDPKAPAWKPDVRVTVVGDAAHPCPPVGGPGANGAFEDVAALSEVIRSGMGVEEFGRFEEEMRERAKGLIVSSAAGSGRFFGMKPLEELEPERIWNRE